MVDGKVDLCIFRWKSEIELQCLAIECKPVISAGNIYGVLDQLSRYRDNFPSLYLLAGSVRNEKSAEEVCRAKGIGLYEATPKSVRLLVEAGIREANEAKYAAVRSVGASLLSFRDEFPGATLESWGARIPASPGRLQFNAFPNTPTGECRFGINAENLHAARVIDHWDELARAIKGLPKEGLVRVWKNIQQARLPNRVPIMSVRAEDFGDSTREGLEREKNVTWHINVSIPLWSFDELLPQSQHKKRLANAVRELTPMFNALGGALSEDDRGKRPKVGVLAFGSLIWAPEPDLDAVVADRIDGVVTPFNVEFARKSKSRGYGPTLVRVGKGGAKVRGMILVIKENVTVDEATAILKKRERGADVSRLNDFHGIKTVLYADPAQNIEDLSPKVLAALAIESIRLAEPGRDGITYLKRAKEQGIVTALMGEYEKEVLNRSGATNLSEVLVHLAT